MRGVYTIKIAPVETFGRSLQLAGVGAMLGELIESGAVTVNLERGEIRVDPTDYADAAEEMLRLLEEGIYGRMSIKLYTGGTPDTKILAEGTKKKPGAGLHVCQREPRSVSWVEAAKCYLKLVVDKGGPLGQPKNVPLLSLMRVTVYSKVRGVWSRSRGSNEFAGFDINADVDTIGLALVGGTVALIASYIAGRGREQERQEVYLVPGESLSSVVNAGLVYMSFHTVSSTTGSTYNDLVRELRRSEELSASWDIVLQLASYIHLSDLLEYLVEVGDPYSSFYLVSIDASGRRPQAYSAQVVSAFSVYSRLRDVVASRLVWALRSSSRIRDESTRRGVLKTLSRCIHSLFNYYWSGSRTYIYECVRLVEASASSLRLKEGREAERAAEALEALARSLAAAGVARTLA
ncbi:MAG: hypothetical protein F7B17_04435 [Desulfurococcales archaeon]|nr:hypothetical protein [Desulfurococcales archaeon]